MRGIVIASPGGLLGGGGIGSVSRAMKQWIDAHHPEISVTVIDPRSEGGAIWTLVYLPLAMLRLTWLRVVRRYDVLHIQVSERLSFVRKSALLVLGRTLGMRVVLHHHGAELIPCYRSGSPASRTLVRWAARTAHVNVVLGEVWRRFLEDEVGIDKQRIVVRVNATADLRNAAPQSADPWHFLLMANLSPRKGVSELLVAVAALARQGMPVRLTLAGGGDVSRYRDEANALSIGERCTFAGWISGSAVADLLHSGATVVLPSHHEGLPMTLLEALSASMPIVTTPVGSIAEHFEHEVHCLFVQPGDPVAIAAALSRLANEPSLRDRLAHNGRQLYEKRFGIDGYMHRMLALYGEVHQQRLAPGSANFGP